MRLRVITSVGQPFDWASGGLPFRVGRADSCALRFHGESASLVSWEHAEFGLGSDGLFFVNDLGSTNGTYVDGTRVSAPTLVRIGSMVHMGRTGPCLEVLELMPRAVPIAAMPIAVPASSPVRSIPGTGTAQHPSVLKPGLLRHWRSTATIAGILVFGFIIVPQVMSLRVARVAPPEVAGTQVEKLTPRPEIIPATKSTTPSPLAPTRLESQPATAPEVLAPDAAKNTAPTSNSDPWKDAREMSIAGFRLIVVEDPKTQAAWPFAGAVVIGEKTLLTTASVAIELAKFQERGWQVTVMRDAQQARVAIREIRVHAAYQKESEDQQLYFDMAVLFTGESLANALTMASIGELAELETGRTLACLAVNHTGDPLDRFQQLQPQIYVGKIFAVTSLPPQPGGPQLLHLRGAFTDKACGSPIVNDRGHLVALYCEPSPAIGSGQENIRIHYAKVIEPQLIQLAMNGPDEKVWLLVKTNAASPPSQESPK